jgi:hypothetical protein
MPPKATKAPVVLTREQILAADDIKKELIQIPQWGGPVYVIALNALERDEFDESCIEQKNGKRVPILRGMRTKLVIRCTVDAAGKPIFTAKDYDALLKKNAAAVDRIFGVAQRLSGITEEDMEELAKNSERG